MSRMASSPDLRITMLIRRNTEQLRTVFYFLTLVSAMLSIMLTFIDIKAAKVLFYWSFYFSLAGILFNRKDVDRSRLWFLAMMAILGASKLIWFYWEYYDGPDYTTYNDYMNAGKRLLLVCVTGYWLFSQMQHFRAKSILCIKYGLLTAFAAATAYGFWQYFSDMHRVEFALDRATISAYGYAMLSMVVLFLLASEKHSPGSMLCCLAIFLLSWFVLMQTGTRNMMAAYPLIILVVGVLQFRHFGLKSLLAILVAVGVLVALSYKPIIKPKLDTTFQEYTLYNQSNGNENGSLTTRLAMWQVGWWCLSAHPLGMKSEDRTACFQRYVDTYHKDSVSMLYEKVHLHNEVLDTASLQGIQGAVVLLMFYLSLVVYALRSQNSLLLAVMLGVIVSGLTDVVFISRELTVCVALMLVVCEMWNALTRPRITHSD